MDLVMITGLSGAGKSRAVAIMEDIGYYCVDNLPPKMVKAFTDLCMMAPDRLGKVAIVMDARSGDVFENLSESLEPLLRMEGFRLVFLDCEEHVLIQRFKETRRRHPLMDEETSSVEEAIRKEKALMSVLKETANYVVDTTFLSVGQLRENLTGLFLQNSEQQGMLVSCVSFGFKFGLPKEADLAFDVRCLPNPFYIPDLKSKTGLDQPVRDYVMSHRQAQELAPKLLDLIDFLVPLYQAEGKSQLTIAIGCTGGKHRSVTFAQLIGEHLQKSGVRTTIFHRDITRGKD